MSHHSALKSFIKSKTALQRVVFAEDFHEVCEGRRGADVKKLILDDGYWASVTELRAVMECWDIAKERWSGFLTPVVALIYLLHPVNIMKFGRDGSIIELAEQFIRDSHDEEMAIIMIRSLWTI